MQISETSDLTVRHISLDALRGFAVMGILAMNIVAFAMPQWAYITPLAYGGETSADRMTWLLSFIFIDGKMRGLFALLFGASMMLIIERAQAKDENGQKVHFRRMVWLALFGLIHYFFIWFGDILFTYALTGCIAYIFCSWPPRRLIKWALVIAGIGLLIWGAQFGGLQVLQIIANAPGASADMVKTFQEAMADPGFDFNIAKELTVHRGSYSDIVAYKLEQWFVPFSQFLQTLPEILSLMMIGMAMKKNGFITGEMDSVVYRKWALWLVMPGLVLTTMIAVTVVQAGYDKIDALAAFMAWSIVPRFMMVIGYAALLILLIGQFKESALIARVAATGQAAFSNYLGTSIVMTTIFYGYGLGLFGYVGRAHLWLFVIGAWMVMLLWAQPWLKRFRYGPLEWLWRSLARFKIQPMRRSLETIT
jgi:uncharacterized protein